MITDTNPSDEKKEHFLPEEYPITISNLNCDDFYTLWQKQSRRFIDTLIFNYICWQENKRWRKARKQYLSNQIRSTCHSILRFTNGSTYFQMDSHGNRIRIRD